MTAAINKRRGICRKMFNMSLAKLVLPISLLPLLSLIKSFFLKLTNKQLLTG